MFPSSVFFGGIPASIATGIPFAGADNGLSVDGTGKVVLGNDLGDPLQPAILLSNREIPTGVGNAILLIDSGGNITTLAAGVIQIFSGASANETEIDPGIVTITGDSSATPPELGFFDNFDGTFFGQAFTTDRYSFGITSPRLEQFKASHNWQIGNFSDPDFGIEIFNVANGMAVVNDTIPNNLIDIANGPGGGTVGIALPNFTSFHGNYEIFDNSTFDLVTFILDEVDGESGFNFELASRGANGKFVFDINTGLYRMSNQNSSSIVSAGADFQVFGTFATNFDGTGSPGIWQFAQFEAGAVVPTDGIRIRVDGVDYKIPAVAA